MLDLKEENIQLIMSNGKVWINNEIGCLVRIQGIINLDVDNDGVGVTYIKTTRCPNPECNSPNIWISKSDEGASGGCDDCGWSM